MSTPLSSRYTRAAMAFHWSMAVLIVIAGVIGLTIDDFPRPERPAWINMHALLGLLVFVLCIARLGWRASHPPPPPHPDTSLLVHRGATLMHWAMYALLLVIPLIGIVTFIWHGRILNLGLMHVDFGVKSDRAIFHPTEEVHGYLAYTLFALAGLHILAALWHQFVRRDGLLSRMWPT